MIKVTRKEWNKIPEAYKGKFEDYQGNNPEFKGLNTVMLGCIKHNGGTALVFEGIHFKIID
mgnify:CR=1 FL=1